MPSTPVSRWEHRQGHRLGLHGGDVAGRTPLDAGWRRLWEHRQVCDEVSDLMDVLQTRTDHLHATLTERPDVPLQVHARSTRIETLAAFGDKDGATVAAWQTGVRWLEQQRADLLAFTRGRLAHSGSGRQRASCT